MLFIWKGQEIDFYLWQKLLIKVFKGFQEIQRVFPAGRGLSHTKRSNEDI